MLKRFISLGFLVGLALVPGAALAQGAPEYGNVVTACGTPNGASYAVGTNRPTTVDTTGKSCGSATGTVTGTVTANQGTPNAGTTQSWPVDTQRVNGAAVNVGTGAASTGTQRVTTSTDSTIGTVTAVTTLTTVTNPVGIKGADGSGISSNANPVPVSDAGGSITVDCGATTCSANTAQVNGVTTSTGAGAVGTGSQRVSVGQDTTTIAGSAPGTAASPSANVLSGVDLSSAASAAGVVPVFSSAVETGHVIKAGAGNLYSVSASADATLSAAAWAIMVFNSTTVPASGAVTPAWCVLLPAGATAYTGAFPHPMYLGTGISVAISVGQTCFTKTDSAHGFISATAQ